jgi:AraC family transcriptional regulator
MNTCKLWKPTENNRFTFRDFAVMRGGPTAAGLPEHSHRETQISMRFGPEPEAYDCRRAGEVSLYAPHQSHLGGWQAGSQVLVIHLASGLMDAAADELAPNGRWEVRPMMAGRDALLEAVGSTLLKDFCTPESLTPFYLDSLANFLAARIVRRHSITHALPSPQKRLSDSQVAAVRRYIQQRIESGFTVMELAVAVGLPVHRFTERLRVTTGMSPWAFVQQHRITMAERMLRDRRLSMAEITHRLGFSSQSHFTNAFRRAMRTTPRAYRELL